VAAICTENLTKVFPGRRGSQVRAVDGLCLTVQEGRALAFLGPNGAGKTTAIYLILGLRRPTAGGGQVLGQPLGSVRAKARIGFLPEAMNPKGYYSTEEMLRFCARLYGISETIARERVDYVLEALNLGEVRAQRSSQLSKGMVQRLGLAQALVNDPDLLILDEPTSNLDPVGRREVMRLLLDLKARGKTIFISSHVLSEVELVCDDVAIINRGRLVQQGALAELAGRSGGYEITTRGVAESVRAELAHAGAQLDTRPDGAVVIWGPDEETQQRLLAILVSSGCPVLSASKRSSTLEELFFEALEQETPT
jgi:ABC-2 type transport system ATP-binding protein